MRRKGKVVDSAIIVALITAGFGFAGVLVANIVTIVINNKKLMNSIQTENAKVVNNVKLEFATYKASTDEKITELTREVREHNNFAKRMPVVENEIKHIEEKMCELHKND